MDFILTADADMSTTDICPNEFVVGIHKRHQENRVESFVVQVLGPTLWRTAAGHVLPIKCPTCMGKVPSLEELVSYGAPTIRSTRANQHLIHVLVNNGLIDFSAH